MAYRKKTKEEVVRARQFIPFDALKGFKEELKKREEIRVQKVILSEEDSEILSNDLNKLKRGQIVEVTYFKNDNYVKKTGLVSLVDEVYKNVTIVKDTIDFDDILRINFLD